MSDISNFLLNKVKINGFTINSGNIEILSIFEGIGVPALTGEITLKDREGLLELHELLPGDKIQLEFITKAAGTKPLIYDGILTDADNSMYTEENTMPMTTLRFCTPWWFKAITKTVSKSYKDVTFEDILTDLIGGECGGSFAGAFDPPSTIIERFVTPYWTVAHLIKYILDWGHDSGLYAYQIYENLNGGGITYALTLDFLHDENWGKHKSKIMLNPQNMVFEGRAQKIQMESYFNSMRYLNQGVWQTDYLSFNYDRTEIYTSDKSAKDAACKHLALSVPLKAEHQTKEFKSVRKTYGPFHQQKKINSKKEFENWVDGIRDNNYINVFGDMVKFNVLLHGATDREAGMIAEVKFPSINTKADQTLHRFLEGDYLVRNIRHIFKQEFYHQAITLTSDSFGMMKRGDIGKW